MHTHTQYYANDELQVADLNVTGLTLQLFIGFKKKPMNMRHDVSWFFRHGMLVRRRVRKQAPAGTVLCSDASSHALFDAMRAFDTLSLVARFARRPAADLDPAHRVPW